MSDDELLEHPDVGASRAQDGAGGAIVVLDDVTTIAPLLPGLTTEDRDRVEKYALRASADNTLRAYRSDWKLFVAWCAARHYSALPATPETVAAYLTDLADNGTSRTSGRGLAKATIGRKLAAIIFAHRVAELDPPTQQAGAAKLDRAVTGIRASQNRRPIAKKRAATAEIVTGMIAAIPGEDLRSLRDRALIAVGMTGALRRSELVAIHLEHLTFSIQGVRLNLGPTKTDREGKGASIVIPRGEGVHAVAHLERWLEASRIASGPVFLKFTPQGRLGTKAMSDHGAALVIKAAAASAGYDPAAFSGHSLRAGFLTEAASQGEDLFRMKRQSRHKSTDMVAEYVRYDEDWIDHAGRKFS